MKSRALFALIFFVGFAVFAETPIDSPKATYTSDIALMGKPSDFPLNYRNMFLSSSSFRPQGPWDYEDFLPGSRVFSIVDIQKFVSWNSAYPYGGNDGLLWQGKGINTHVSGGIVLRFDGLSITAAPELIYSQNNYFPVMDTAYPESHGFGYLRSAGMDAYQRPGKDYVFAAGWGESEIRYSWNRLSLGFGYQQAWIGPGVKNALMLSNNAPPFPKFDFGLNATETPIGLIEFRSFIGRLEESDYFDSDSSNDASTIYLLSASYAPYFAPGLTLGFHRSLLVNGSAVSVDRVFALFGGMSRSSGRDEADQRASVTAKYAIPEAGFEIYAEWAKNDYSPNAEYLFRYPFHAQGYTLGFRKGIFPGSGRANFLVIGAEISNTESSRDYELLGPYSFYGHSIVSHGYTNQGQILGASFGTGGNGQYIDVDYYFPWGKAGLHFHRINRDNDYVYFLHFGDPGAKRADEAKFNTELSFGIDGILRYKPFILRCEATYIKILNPLYNPRGTRSSVIDTVHIELSMCLALAKN